MKLERLLPGDHNDQELENFHRARYKFASQFVPNKPVLDVACGTGYGTRMLADAGAHTVVGIDVSDGAIKYAKANYGIEGVEFRTGDAEHLGDMGKVDVATSFETIEHLNNPELFLEGIAGLINDGGIFIISTPIRLKGTISTKPENPYHVREWDEPEFIALLSRHFTRCDVYYQFGLRKFWYPGSRTISKTVSKVINQAQYESFMTFPVVKECPPSLPGVLSKEYIVVTCSQ